MAVLTSASVGVNKPQTAPLFFSLPLNDGIFGSNGLVPGTLDVIGKNLLIILICLSDQYSSRAKFVSHP